ncbi:MAG: tetratricopeptide repeat protein [Sedimentisphaerales bacterium]|nr:tetratricopeptide repeat protein [Sedimentisphaerales bacterium]
MQVATADLIWNWLGQTAETLRKPDAAQAMELAKIVEFGLQKDTSSIQHRLDEYRKKFPRTHYADLAAGAVALSDGRLNEAFELFNGVYVKCPRNVTALYALGHCCERLGREAEAIAFYQDCLKFKNFLQLPRQRLAAIYFKNGQIEKTIREYEKLKEEYPDDLSTAITLGYLYIAVKKFKLACDTFTTGILIQPDNFRPDNDPIDTLIETGEFDGALRQIDEALEEFPDRPDLLLRRGFVFAKLDQPEEALQEYSRAVEICPDFLEANIRLGSYYLHLGRPDSAVFQLSRAVSVNDRIVDAYIGLSTAQKLAGNTGEALASLSMASAVETNGPILFAEAVRLQSQCLPDVARDESQTIISAIHAYNLLLKAHPHNPQIHYRLGCLLMSVGRFSQAIELFSKAVELHPTFSAARNKLAVCLYEDDEKAFALEHLLTPACLQKETIRLHYQLSILYCDKIKFAESMLNLESWLRETLTSGDAALNISVVLQNLGLIDPANIYLDNPGAVSERTIN